MGHLRAGAAKSDHRSSASQRQVAGPTTSLAGVSAVGRAALQQADRSARLRPRRELRVGSDLIVIDGGKALSAGVALSRSSAAPR
jgi:hypothetical protein